MFNYIFILLEVWGEDEGLYDMYNISNFNNCYYTPIFYWLFFWKKARELSLDDKEILVGCLSLENKYHHRRSSDSWKYDVNIDGKIYNTLDIRISGFPYYSKQFSFEEKIDQNVSCYRVKYVKVGYLFFERRYIYDLVDW